MESRVVIIGAGFGGLACAQELGRSSARVTIIDRHNYHLFVPLLYQVATAALSPADIAHPIRRILGRYKNIDVLLGEVVAVESEAKTVRIADGQIVHFDRLVIATGSEYSYFGHPEWAPFAPGPRTLEQARRIRSHLLTAFERAEMSQDPAEQEKLMTIVIVGGGPTGVEMAGSVAELTRHALARDFHRIDPRSARILLLEAGPRILPSFPADLADYAKAALEQLGVTVMTGQAVSAINQGGVDVGERYINAGTVIWGAGVQGSPAGRWLAVDLDRSGRIPVEPDLSVRGLKDIYALGDTALTHDVSGAPLPALAQVAQQQGKFLGRALAANLQNGQPILPFKFKNRGNAAIVGRHSAIFDFGWWKFKGRLAWMLWALVHVVLLVGFEKRILVTMQWAWQYITYQRGARLIMPERE